MNLKTPIVYPQMAQITQMERPLETSHKNIPSPSAGEAGSAGGGFGICAICAICG